MTSSLRFLWLESGEVTHCGLEALRWNTRAGDARQQWRPSASVEVKALLSFRKLKRLSLPLTDVSLRTLKALAPQWWLRELRPSLFTTER